MPVPEKLDTHQKALSLNLDPYIFGSFAEIGAGQEVARWFLQVGAASGTVAKTISAYDKEVSDDLYGAGTRYVSQPRLQSMLEHEWAQLLSQLNESRGAKTRFFSFVDTVSARNFAGDNECHGWIGLRFQMQPLGVPSDVTLHVNLRDRSNLAQQAAVGILGVNLIYAAYHYLWSPDEFLSQVAGELALKRIEIDSVQLNGPAFTSWDAREIHASLVADNLAEAVVFPTDGQLIPPTELLYKKAVVLAPGTFDVVDPLFEKMIETTIASLPKEDLAESKGSLGLFCLSCAQTSPDQPPLNTRQVLEHVNALQKLGSGTLVFRQREIYRMGEYVNRYTRAPIHFSVGFSVLVRMLVDNYRGLPGALLEGIARLFRENVRLCVFPMPVDALRKWRDVAIVKDWKWKDVDGYIGALDVEPTEPLLHLYRYLVASGFIIPKQPASLS